MPGPQRLFRSPENGSQKIQTFIEQVNKDKAELDRLLEQKMQEIESSKGEHRGEVATLLRQAFQPSSALGVGATPAASYYNGTSIAKNTVFTSANDTITLAKDLIHSYDSLEKDFEDIRQGNDDQVVAEWNGKLKKVEQLLGLGRKKAVRDVKKVLGLAEGNDKGQRAGAKGDAVDEMEIDGLKGTFSGRPDDVELARSLRYAERGVKRMGKALGNE